MPDNQYRLPPDIRMEASAVPLSETIDWSMRDYGLPALWAKARGVIGKGARRRKLKACVLDTGIDTDHPDLKDAIAGAADFTRSMYGPRDRHGHGSWVCGCIGAVGGNDVGVHGIADCEIYSAKVLGDSGAGNDQTIYRGLAWGLDNDCDFFSLSLGGPEMGRMVRELLLEIASQRDKFIFAAAGNDGGRVNAPAKYRETIGVGAVDKAGRLTAWSSRGPELDIVAPGVDMLSCGPDGNYLKMSGTSMATPFACGIGMLAYAAHENARDETALDTIDDMRVALKATASKHVNGRFGLIDPSALIDELDDEAPSVDPNDPGDGPPVTPDVGGDRILVSIPKTWVVG